MFIELIVLIYLTHQFIQSLNTIYYTVVLSLVIIVYIFIRRSIISKKIIHSINSFKANDKNTQKLYDDYINLVSFYPLEESLIKVSKLINSTIQEKNELIEKNNRLFNKIQLKNKILKITHEINNAFIENDSYDIYQLILDEAINLLPICDYGSLLIYKEEDYHFIFKAVNGYDYAQFKDLKIDLKHTFIYQNSDNGFNDSVIVKDIYDHNKKFMTPEEANALNTSMTKDIKETLSIPIKVKEKIFGILNIDTKKQFTSEDIEILNYYADSIVSNLYNSQLLEKTIYLSRYDKLTNIYNRNFFEDILEDVIEESITENYYFAFVLLDMNYLKEINDNYGHKVGDDALIHLTDSIKKYLKKDDIFARLGGDEFVVIFDKTDFDTAEQKIKYILDDLINNPLSVNSNVDLEKLPVTFSYGISTAPYESLVLDILLKLSDHRMYEFKTKFKEKYPELKPGSN
jgi:diguanylate cyclase (GGDEF)-like protein